LGKVSILTSDDPEKDFGHGYGIVDNLIFAIGTVR
jgi:hypothetical protein